MFAGIRHTLRLIAIARTLRRHDALFPLDWVQGAGPLPWLANRFRRRGVAGRPGERLAAALQELGPSFIKLGQSLSTRADLLGEELADDLSRLQDRLPPFPGEVARRIVAEELGAPIDSLFASFDDVPVAAASIAQVHFAVTTAGEPVAVKVLRPGVEAAFERDLALFHWLARLAERLDPRQRRLRPVETVRTLAATVRTEMDLRLEAAAASEFAENFADDPTVRVPRIVWRHTARRVLTLERVAGIPLDERERLVAAGHDVEALLTAAANSFFKQVFRFGFFHADMHAGNIFVDEDGVMVIVDFGIMGRLDRETRDYLADMLFGFLTRDYEQVARVHFRAGYIPADEVFADFAQACRAIGEPILERPLAEISIGRLLLQLFQVTETFHMQTQPQLLLLQKTMLMAEGMGRRLRPDVNIWALARPLIEDWFRENRGPVARLRRTGEELLESLERLPALLDTIEIASARIAAGDLFPDRRANGLMARLWPVWLGAAVVAVLALAFG